MWSGDGPFVSLASGIAPVRTIIAKRTSGVNLVLSSVAERSCNFSLGPHTSRDYRYRFYLVGEKAARECVRRQADVSSHFLSSSWAGESSRLGLFRWFVLLLCQSEEVDVTSGRFRRAVRLGKRTVMGADDATVLCNEVSQLRVMNTGAPRRCTERWKENKNGEMGKKGRLK